MKNENLARIKKDLQNTIEEFENRPEEKINNPPLKAWRKGYKEGSVNIAKSIIRLIESIENE